MRNLIALLITLLLGYIGKMSGMSSAEPIWALGMLLILTPLGAELAERIGLPPLIGCTAVGLVLGPQGTRLIVPEALAEMEIVRILALGWIAIQMGVSVHESAGPSLRRLFGLASFVTLASCALTSGVLFATGVPLLPAMTLGILAASFGPFILFTQEDWGDLIPGVMLGGVLSIFALWTAIAFGVEAMAPMRRGTFLLPILEFLGALGLACCLSLVLEHFLPRLTSPTSQVLWMLGVILLLGMICHALALNPILPAIAGGALVARRSRAVRATIATMHGLSRPLHHLLFGMTGVYLSVAADFSSAGTFWPVLLAYITCLIVGKISITAIGTRIFRIRKPYRDSFEFALLPQGILTFEILRTSQEHFVGMRSFQSSWSLVCTTATIGLLLGAMIFPAVFRYFATSPNLPEVPSEQIS